MYMYIPITCWPAIDQSDSSDESEREKPSMAKPRTPASTSKPRRGRGPARRQGRSGGQARNAGDDEGYEGSGEEGGVRRRRQQVESKSEPVGEL